MATFPQFSTCWPKQNPKFPSVSCFCEYILALNCRQPKLIEVMNLLPKWFLGCAYNLLFIFLCSVAKWYPTLCDPIDFSMIGFPVFTISCSLLKFMSIGLMMPAISSSVTPFSSCPQSFLGSGWFPVCQLFIRWSKYWSFSITPSNKYSGLISFRIDWFDLFAVQGTLKSLLQHHSLKASFLQFSAFFVVQFSHLYMTTGKAMDLTIWTFCWQRDVSTF